MVSRSRPEPEQMEKSENLIELGMVLRKMDTLSGVITGSLVLV